MMRQSRHAAEQRTAPFASLRPCAFALKKPAVLLASPGTAPPPRSDPDKRHHRQRRQHGNGQHRRVQPPGEEARAEAVDAVAGEEQVEVALAVGAVEAVG
jgi:hypothetical protein